MARLSSELVLSLTDRVSGPAAGVGRSLDKLKRNQQGLARSSRLTAEGAAEMGRAQSLMLAGASRVLAPVAGAFSAAQVISSAADFETALTNIQKKAGATAEQTAKLGEEIKALATSGELAVPIEEIAAAYERGAAAGIPLDELRAFASLSAKAADAFEMSATDVANASAGFTNVLKVPRAEMERYFDLINGLADSGIADESGIVDYVDQAGAMAKTFGLSAQETAAFGAALANLKVSAAKGATATNAIFTRLMAPDALSSDARTAYYQLIKDDKKFKKQLASGKADEAFVDVLDSLRAMKTEARTGVIVELFGQDHLDVMTQMVEGADELKRNLAYAAGTDWFGSLDKSYKLKLDDFWSQWQLVKNALGKLTIDAGTMGMPALKAGLDSLLDLIGQIGLGMSQFEARVDWTSISEARGAVADLAEDVAGLLGIDTSNSHILTFFRDLAEAVNTIASGVKAVKEGIDWLNDPMGLQTPEGKRPAEPADESGWFEKFRSDSVRPGSVADRTLETVGGWLDRVDDRHEAAHPKRPRDDLTVAPSDTMGALQTDRVRPAPYDPFASTAGRVPPPKDVQDEMSEALRDRYRMTRPQPVVQPAPVSGTPASPPTPTPRPVATPTAVDGGRVVTGIPVPSPRPDIAAEVKRQSDEAAMTAEAAGQRISAAFSMTVAPRIDPSSIAAADAVAAKLEARLQRIAGQQARIREGAAGLASASAGAADYDGLQADIED